MNPGVFLFMVITAVALGIWIYLNTPPGKKWLKNL